MRWGTTVDLMSKCDYMVLELNVCILYWNRSGMDPKLIKVPWYFTGKNIQFPK